MALFTRLVSLLLVAQLAPLIFVVASYESDHIKTREIGSSRLHRHLLHEHHRSTSTIHADRETAVKPDRSGDGKCSKDYIVVYQSQTAPQPDGIPTYSVQVLNTCLDQGCSSNSRGISAIHLRCGWFSTARLINPKIFRRLGHDDCLVNDGLPVPPGGVISFEYTNTYSYTLSVSSISCA